MYSNEQEEENGMTAEQYFKSICSRGGKKAQKVIREKYTPEEISAMRSRAGKLGGRPKKTVENSVDKAD